ncbi:trehalose-phosphatase [Sphingomonas sabuli]|uniref:Trehalose 6-phosphate phosphatase n=1 Tax=Sphingomonas sabuli TaxID=2764186 RepID=A0A7G9L034_9SPHN|nr:trehalose-phosphatase [Sphingomonas sabuli]QNM81983.1 trehalose-phosphatase [Sphingomonas sabuli]
MLGQPPASLLDGASMFLDLDGTLVHFADHPDAIVVDEKLRTLLLRLHDVLDGRLAIISGRGLDDLAGRLGLDAVAMAGSHGAEYCLAGGIPVRSTPPANLDDVTAAIIAFAKDNALVAELKPAGAALHFRTAPEMGQAARAFAIDLASRNGFITQDGSMVIELRAPGSDKGAIVRSFMAEPPFASGRPVAVGDDLTDEDAFDAAIALGGSAVIVGPRAATSAQYRLDGVDALRTWLEQAR